MAKLFVRLKHFFAWAFAPRILTNRLLPPKNFAAMTLWPFILRRPYTPLSASTLNHEKIHLQQQLELGLIGFYLVYLTHYLYNLVRYHNRELAYREIVFEREAYAHERDLGYLRRRPLWAFRHYFKKK